MDHGVGRSSPWWSSRLIWPALDSSRGKIASFLYANLHKFGEAPRCGQTALPTPGGLQRACLFDSRFRF